MIRLRTSTAVAAHVAALGRAGFEVVVEVVADEAIELDANDTPPVRLTSSIDPEDLVTVARVLVREQQLRARVDALDHLERRGAIAHDINNILVPVVAAAQQLATDGSTLANDIATCCVRASVLLRRMLSPAESVGEVDVYGLVASLAPILRMTARGRQLTISGSSGALVRGDSLDLERVLLNLVQNAQNATPEGGHVSIATTAVDAVPGDDVPAGRWVVITVEDDATGMDALTLERARGGFFTTKEAGTGLGLVSVSRTARAFGGFVRIDAAPKGGTRVRLVLPAAIDDA